MIRSIRFLGSSFGVLIGLTLASDGHLITANSDGTNANPLDPSTLVEYGRGGRFIGKFSVDPTNGGAFAVTITAGPRPLIAYVDDVTGTVTVNVGGGRACSLSLLEASSLCAEISGRETAISASDESRPGDVPIYLSDCRRLFSLTDWRPVHGPREILTDIHAWIVEHEAAVRAAL